MSLEYFTEALDHLMTFKNPDITDHTKTPNYLTHFTTFSKSVQLLSVTDGKREI